MVHPMIYMNKCWSFHYDQFERFQTHHLWIKSSNFKTQTQNAKQIQQSASIEFTTKRNKGNISNHIIHSKVEQIQIKISFIFFMLSWNCFKIGHRFHKNLTYWSNVYVKTNQLDGETQMTAYGFLDIT